MEVQPFVKCLHPIRIINKYTGEPIITNCGKCKACLLHKASNMSLRCQLESSVRRYCMFVTLTHDNEHLPMAEPIPYIDDLGQECVKLISLYKDNQGDELNNIVMSHRQLQLLQDKLNLKGSVPFLHYPDIQKFLKRLRKHLGMIHKRYCKRRVREYTRLLSKTTNENTRKKLLQKIRYYENKKEEKIRYYVVGELGPVHFRPHWHMLLWFEEAETLMFFAEALYKSWQAGRVDFSLSRGSASSYCASYVNSTCSIPEIFKSKEIRPKQFHSKMLGEDVFPTTREEALYADPRTIVNVSVPLNGTNTDVAMWRSLKARYMPICKGYNRKSRLQRAYSYGLYGKVRTWTSEVSPYKQAKWLTEFILENGYTSSYTYDTLPPIYRDEVQGVLDYFLKETHTVELSLLENPLVKYGDRYEQKEDYKQYLFNSIYYELYVSKRFSDLVQLSNTSTDYVLNKIEEFYSTLDYDNLKSMYKQQEAYMELSMLTPHTMMYMYNNCPRNVCTDKMDNIKSFLLEQPLYMLYKSKVEERFEKSIKHKVLNDKNKIFLKNG